MPGTHYTVEAPSDNGKLQEHVESREPLAEQEECARQGDRPVSAAPLRPRRTDGGTVFNRFDPAQLHQPFHQGVGAAPGEDDCNSLCGNALQHLSTDCTSARTPGAVQ